MFFGGLFFPTSLKSIITMNMKQKAASVDAAVRVTGPNYSTNNDIILHMPCMDPVEISDSNHTKITSDWVVTNHLDHAKTVGGTTGTYYGAAIQSVL